MASAQVLLDSKLCRNCHTSYSPRQARRKQIVCDLCEDSLTKSIISSQQRSVQSRSVNTPVHTAPISSKVDGLMDCTAIDQHRDAIREQIKLLQEQLQLLDNLYFYVQRLPVANADLIDLTASTMESIKQVTSKVVTPDLLDAATEESKLPEATPEESNKPRTWSWIPSWY